MTDEAAARLTAINEYQDLGSGMRIAMRDLEIRGAGSMLGAEQSGNMSAVGFDLFAQMLSQAVNDTREKGEATGDLPPALSDITVNVPGHAYLPEEYIPDADTRVLWYRKLASAPTVDDVEALREELLEKAPDMPDAAANLFERAWLKAFANEHNVKVISVVAGNLVVDPIDIPQDKMKPLRRAGARYNTDKRKLTLPLRYFTDEERDNLMPPIARFLEEMFGEKDEDESVPFAEVEGASSEAGLGAGKNDGAGSPVPSLAGGVAGAAATRTPAGPAGSGAAPRSASASGRPTARSERRARNQAKGEAARERLAAKRAARAAKRKEE